MKRGAVSWSTIAAVDTGGETSFGHVSIDVGDNTLLTVRLKLWNINLNEYSKIAVSSSPDANPVPNALDEIIGPMSGGTAEIEFPSPNRFVALGARVQEDQAGFAACEFAIVE